MRSGLLKPAGSGIKAQSAMEYLMTYGWAVLVIAIIASLLMAFGIFDLGNSSTPNSCVPISGFGCSSPSYTTNGVSAVISEGGGSYYNNAWGFITSDSEHIGSSGLPDNFSTSSTDNMVHLGILAPGQTVTLNYSGGAYAMAGDIPTNEPVGYPFTGYVWLAYCMTPNCNAPTNYVKIATVAVQNNGGSSSLSGGGSSQTGSSTTSTSSTSTTSTSTTSSTTSSTSSTTTTIGTTYDPMGGYTGSNNIIFDSGSSGSALTGSITTTANITIESGVSLTSEGFSFIAGGNFINDGTISTGYGPGGGSGSSGTGTAGTSESLSYGGSGGGGGSNGQGGAGGTAPNPAPTLSLVQEWANDPLAYLSGAGGGGGGGSGGGGGDGGSSIAPGGAGGSGGGAGCGSGGNGGAGAHGIYIQAYSITAGQIQAPGEGGGGGNIPAPGGGCGAGGGGGGGGGAILLAYYSSYTASPTYGGGAGQGGTATNGQNNGAGGGAGQLIHYQYTTQPVPT